MPFGLPDSAQRISYGGYLQIDRLLSLQQLRSDPAQHDETLFIVIHQTYELWFKQILHELERVIRHLDADEALGAHRLLRRCIEIEKVLVAQLTVLETMTPMDFLSFRDHLMPASGFQSVQFREIECIGGLGDPRLLEYEMLNAAERARLAARLAQPTLRSAFFALLDRRGFAMPEEPAREVGDGGTPAYHQRVDALARLYGDAERHYDLFLLTESLVEYDELVTLWRFRHVQMVERVIGGRQGTGGSEGAAYLRSTLGRRFFPELWDARGVLGGGSATAAELAEVGHGQPRSAPGCPMHGSDRG